MTAKCLSLKAEPRIRIYEQGVYLIMTSQECRECEHKGKENQRVIQLSIPWDLLRSCVTYSSEPSAQAMRAESIS